MFKEYESFKLCTEKKIFLLQKVPSLRKEKLQT